MKRLFSMILCLALVISLALPVLAASPRIIFTGNSNFTVGGTVRVDETETLGSVYDNGMSEEYNAYLEHNVQYYWMRNGSYYAEGLSITLTEADQGCTFYCMAALFEDEDRTQQISTIYSDSFTVPYVSEPPVILTESLADGKVGQKYQFALTCTDEDAVFSLYQGVLPDGLVLTQHGQIEGLPTKAGTWKIIIRVVNEAGQEGFAGFFLTIAEGQLYTLEILKLPQKLTYTVGETLDLTGLQVRIHTPTGVIDSQNGDGLAVQAASLQTLGEHRIELRYEDGTATFTITVTAPEESKPTNPKEEDQNPVDPGDTTIGADNVGIDITTVIIIVLAAVAVAAISGVVVILIRQKK